MGATINENGNTFDRLPLEELERQYEEAKSRLTKEQIEQVEKGNLSMIHQFPVMGTAYALYRAIQRKRDKLRNRIAGSPRLML